MAGETVCVACKIPTGLYMEISPDPPKEGAVMAGIPEMPEDRQIINGSAMKREESGLVANSADLIEGFGITEGVPKDLAVKWFEQHKGTRFVDKGFVFMEKDRAALTARIRREMGGVSSQLDGINPDRPGDIDPAFKGKIEKAPA